MRDIAFFRSFVHFRENIIKSNFSENISNVWKREKKRTHPHTLHGECENWCKPLLEFICTLTAITPVNAFNIKLSLT